MICLFNPAVVSEADNFNVFSEVCVWLTEVTDTDFLQPGSEYDGEGEARRQATPLPPVVPSLLMNAGTCDWTAALRFEIPPLPVASSLCGRSEVL